MSIRTSRGSAGVGSIIHVPNPLSVNPADATTYFFGVLSPIAGAGYNRIYIPRAGLIKRVELHFTIVTILGSSELSSVYLRHNNTTDYLLSSVVDNSITFFHIESPDINVVVAKGDFFELKWIAPTWVTNPTSVYIGGSVLVE